MLEPVTFAPIFATNTAVTTATGFTIGADDGDGATLDTNPASPDTYLLSGGTVTANDSGFVNSTFWWQYTGTGTFTVTPDVTIFSSTNVSPAPQSSQDPPAISGFFRVTYDYTPTVTIEGMSYEIVTTESNHFGVGLEIGDYFTADGSEVIDANNTVLPIHSPAATGALIVSTLGGDTRSWTNVDTGFNPNLACEWKIFRVR